MQSNTYYKVPTKKTPGIQFDKNTGELYISGRSLPEDSVAFFNEIYKEVDEYLNNPQEMTTVVFEMDYFNSISSKTILHLILKFEKLLEQGKYVDMLWHYDDEDDMMFEVGEIFKASTKIPVRLLQTIE